MIRVRPLKFAAKPLYPSKKETRMDPLLRELPGRWAGCKKALAAAGLLASITATLAACAPAKVEKSASAMNSFTAYCEPTSSASSGENSPLSMGAPLPPNMVTEKDALSIVRNAAGGVFAKALPYDAVEIKNPVAYLRYDTENKSFTPVSPADDKKKVNIDGFDTGRGIGFEYVSDELESKNEASDFMATGKTIEHAKKDTAYVLVMDAAYADGQQENAVLKEQIEAFVSWLKSEGIL